jgi:two-component system sensor histidine kinase VicK
VVGVLVAGNKIGRGFGERDVAMLSAVADYASVALVNSRLFREVESRARNLQRAYDELRSAERLKDELVQNVSRELRVPLLHAKNYIDLLARGDQGPLSPEQADVARTASDKLAGALRIVENMAGITEADSRQDNRHLISIVDLAHRAIGRYQLAAQGAGIRLAADLPAQPLTVRSNPARIARVFDEYLSNAIRFSPQGGSVTVRVRETGDGQVETEVSDTGLGIPPDMLGRVFERFYQVDSPAARRLAGAGLGLALAKQIVEAHGGRVAAESDGVPGNGSRFSFTLPHATK